MRFLRTEDLPAVYRPNPHYPGPLDRTVADNDNRAIHYPEDIHPLQGGWLALYLARGLSLASALLLLVGVYGLSRQVVPAEPAVAWAATWLVAATPQVLFISSVVSNDILAAALSSLTLWVLVLLLRRGLSNRRAFFLGLLWGLAVLTKVSTLTLGAPIALASIWCWATKRAPRRLVLMNSLFIGLAATLVSGWWFLRVWLLYGTPLGLTTHDAAPWAIDDPAATTAPLLRWLEVFRSFWLALGWGTVRPPEPVYLLLGLSVLLSAIGGLMILKRKKSLHLDRQTAITAVLVTTVIVVSLFLEVWMQRVTAPHGRLLFPALAALVLLLVLGWRALHPRLPFIMAGFLTMLALAVPYFLIRPAYTPPPALTEAELSSLQPILGWQFRDGEQAVAELLSVTPLQMSAPANSVLPVQVCWRSLAQSQEDYAVLLHLIGPEQQLLGARRSYPGHGLYPTSTWPVDRAFCEQMHVEVNEVPQTLAYQVEVGLINESSGQRLVAFERNGSQRPHTFAGRVVLLSPEQEHLARPLPGVPPIQLVGYELPEQWEPGQTQPLLLEWGVTAAVAEDYQTFVHVRDPETGETVAQADGPPLDGWYPTSWWAAGTIIKDKRPVLLPSELHSGSYQVVVGLYNLESGQRLNEYELAMITVQP